MKNPDAPDVVVSFKGRRFSVKFPPMSDNSQVLIEDVVAEWIAHGTLNIILEEAFKKKKTTLHINFTFL